MCIYSRLIQNRKYIPNKKNGGQVPPIMDKRVLAVPIGCGKCMECTKQKTREWQVRMIEDIRQNKNGVMVTLTFSNESIKEISKDINRLTGYERDNEIATIAIRRFTERWRKRTGKTIRHWLVTELGHEGTENIHMHGIVWTDEKEEIKKTWKYGYVFLGTYCNEQTINYTIKYINKIDQKHKEYKPKILNSKGIGKAYTERNDSKQNKYNAKKTKETYTNRQGYQIALPKYWRNKIYTEEEKEKLWIEKIDQKIRWVDGIKIDVSKTMNEYWKAIEEARRKNKRLGYGNNDKNWERKEYEENRRNLLHETRIKEKKSEGIGSPTSGAYRLPSVEPAEAFGE